MFNDWWQKWCIRYWNTEHIRVVVQFLTWILSIHNCLMNECNSGVASVKTKTDIEPLSPSYIDWNFWEIKALYYTEVYTPVSPWLLFGPVSCFVAFPHVDGSDGLPSPRGCFPSRQSTCSLPPQTPPFPDQHNSTAHHPLRPSYKPSTLSQLTVCLVLKLKLNGRIWQNQNLTQS